jgi:hypothetical protein
MHYVNDFSELLKPELKFNLRDRVIALLPPEEEMNKDFQDLADAVLEGIESGNKISFKTGAKEVIVATTVLKSNVEGIEAGDTIYIKPGYTKLLCSLDETNENGERDLHAITKEDIFFVKKEK